MAVCLILGSVLAGCADEEPPRILWAAFPPDTADQVGPYVVEAVVEDNCCLDRVELLLVEDGQEDADRLAMEDMGEGHHGVSFGGFATGTLMLLAIEARDAHGNWARYPLPDSQPDTGCEPGPDQGCWIRFEIIQ